MQRVWDAMRRFLAAEQGQDLLEYAMLAGLIAVTAIGAITALGQAARGVLWQTIASNF
jgi:Flp pilus assembly pilin Flp